MAGILARVTLPATSGILNDAAVNDFVFDGDAGDAVALNAIRDNLTTFYNQDYNGYGAVASYFSKAVNRAANAAEIKYFDISDALDGSGMGSPVRADHFTLAAAKNNPPIPEEVAIVLSFHADFAGAVEEGAQVLDIPTPRAAQNMGAPATHAGNPRPKNRRRGRIYLGPWSNSVVVEEAVTLNCRPDPARIISAINQAAFGLNDTSGPGGAGNWCVWSRRDGLLRPVVGGHTDNAFDTMRSRGVRSTAKLAW